MIDYTIGDDIVALIDHSQGKFKKGDVFTCKGLKQSMCSCKIPLVDIGLISKTEFAFCNICKSKHKESYIYFFKATAFKKLDFDISELTEILENVNQNTNS